METVGTPCQDMSSANASGKGLQGQRSSLLFDLEAKRELYAEVAPTAEVRRLLENMASMAGEDRDTITQMDERPAAIQSLPVRQIPAPPPSLLLVRLGGPSSNGAHSQTCRKLDDFAAGRPEPECQTLSAAWQQGEPAVQGFPLLHAVHPALQTSGPARLPRGRPSKVETGRV